MRIPPRIKICGITRLEDARRATELGAWALGFVFVPASKRAVTAAQVKEILDALPQAPLSVGVFQDALEEEILAVVQTTGLRAVQLHGAEPRELAARLKARMPTLRVLRAFGIESPADLEGLTLEQGEDALLLDARRGKRSGGLGVSFDWAWAQGLSPALPLVLAGGLRADNVGKAIRLVRPFAVDVSGGVESAPGIKDTWKLEAFFRSVEESSHES